MFSDLETVTLALWQNCLREVFRDYSLACGLAMHTKFDDLDLTLRSQVCQNHKLQIFV